MELQARTPAERNRPSEPLPVANLGDLPPEKHGPLDSPFQSGFVIPRESFVLLGREIMAYNYDRRTASLTQRDLAALRYLATPTWTITMSTDMLAAANRLEKRGLVVYTARPPNRAGKLMGGDFRATAAGLRELSLAAARDDSTEE